VTGDTGTARSAADVVLDDGVSAKRGGATNRVVEDVSGMRSGKRPTVFVSELRKKK
jgi:hypothetical protein